MRTAVGLLLTAAMAMPLPSWAAEPCRVTLEDAPALKPAWIVSETQVEAECRSCGLEVRVGVSNRPEAPRRPSSDRVVESKAFLDQMLGGPGQPQATIDYFGKHLAHQSPDCELTVSVGRQVIDGLHFLAVHSAHFCPKEQVQHFGAIDYRAVDGNCHRLVSVNWRYSGPQRREPLSADTLNKIQNVLDRLRWLD